MSKLTDSVSALAAAVCAANGCTLWDVDYVKEAGTYYLRIFIDRDDGVSLDHCEAVSRALDPLLDDADPIAESYILEVSSAGLERVLKKPADFAKCLGKRIKLKLYSPKNGKKEFMGTLTAYDDAGTITLDTDETFTKAETSNVRLTID
ncbi:MAG: ribosome maturation factor RimP [Oscillospiraceae bacterium]|nr:ribosome maturation factor RimP [Oscillospiraceae bacterium]